MVLVTRDARENRFRALKPDEAHGPSRPSPPPPLRAARLTPRESAKARASAAWAALGPTGAKGCPPDVLAVDAQELPRRSHGHVASGQGLQRLEVQLVAARAGEAAEDLDGDRSGLEPLDVPRGSGGFPAPAGSTGRPTTNKPVTTSAVRADPPNPAPGLGGVWTPFTSGVLGMRPPSSGHAACTWPGHMQAAFHTVRNPSEGAGSAVGPSRPPQPRERASVESTPAGPNAGNNPPARGESSWSAPSPTPPSLSAPLRAFPAAVPSPQECSCALIPDGTSG